MDRVSNISTMHRHLLTFWRVWSMFFDSLKYKANNTTSSGSMVQRSYICNGIPVCNLPFTMLNPL